MILETGKQLRLQSGFTLVEMIIVLSVLALLTAAAIPSIDGVLKERQAREPISELLLLAREVRNRALSEQRPYQIAFDSEGFRASRYFNPYGGAEEFDQLQELLAVLVDLFDRQRGDNQAHLPEDDVTRLAGDLHVFEA